MPTSDTYIAKDGPVNEHIEQMRLSATKALLERNDTIVVATVSAIYGLGAPESYLNMICTWTEAKQLIREVFCVVYLLCNTLEMT